MPSSGDRSQRQAARYLGVSVQAVSKAIIRGRLGCKVEEGRKWIPQAALDQFVERRNKMQKKLPLLYTGGKPRSSSEKTVKNPKTPLARHELGVRYQEGDDGEQKSA